MNALDSRLAPAVFCELLNEAVMEHSMLKHPFYQLWNEGKLTKEILAEYSKQYFAHVRAFPTYVSAVHSKCEDMETRQMLLENLIEEERGNENHPELWLRFAESVGVSADEVKSADLLPATRESVNELKKLTKSEDYREGIATLYAYESQIPNVAKTKREGLKSFYGIDDARAVSFFSVHETADVIHQQTALDILNASCQTREEQHRVIETAGKASKALWSFLDGVYDALLRMSEKAGCAA